MQLAARRVLDPVIEVRILGGERKGRAAYGQGVIRDPGIGRNGAPSASARAGRGWRLGDRKRGDQVSKWIFMIVLSAGMPLAMAAAYVLIESAHVTSPVVALLIGQSLGIADLLVALVIARRAATRKN